MIQWFTAKPRAAKMIKTIEKLKILKYYRKYRSYLIFSVKPFSFWHLRLHEEINLLISCRVILFNSSWRAFHNCSVVFGFLVLECSPRVFHIWVLRRPIHNSNIFCLEEVHVYHSLVTWGIVLYEYGRLLSWISQHRQGMIFYKLFINSRIYLSL